MPCPQPDVLAQVEALLRGEELPVVGSEQRGEVPPDARQLPAAAAVVPAAPVPAQNAGVAAAGGALDVGGPAGESMSFTCFLNQVTVELQRMRAAP